MLLTVRVQVSRVDKGQDLQLFINIILQRPEYIVYVHIYLHMATILFLICLTTNAIFLYNKTLTKI